MVEGYGRYYNNTIVLNRIIRRGDFYTDNAHGRRKSAATAATRPTLRRHGRPRVRPWVHRRPIGARRRYRRSHPCKRASVDMYTYHHLSCQTQPAVRIGWLPGVARVGKVRPIRKRFTVRSDNARVSPRACWAAVKGAQCYRWPGATPFSLVFFE